MKFYVGIMPKTTYFRSRPETSYDSLSEYIWKVLAKNPKLILDDFLGDKLLTTTHYLLTTTHYLYGRYHTREGLQIARIAPTTYYLLHP